MIPSKPPNRAAARYGIPALIVMYIVIRAWNLRTFCLDWDEVFSVTTARFGWGTVLQAVANDLVHPPLSYLLLKAWMAAGGASLLWVRLLPFALSVAALAPLLALFRRLQLSPATQALALALVAVNEYQCQHARYVRMYGLLYLLGLISLYLFLAWLDKSGWRRLLALTAVNLLLVYTHYFGWMLIGAEVLALVWSERKLLKQFALATAAVGAAFAPWALMVLASSRAHEGLEPNLRWIRHPGIGDLLWFYAGLAGPLAPIPLASVLLFVWLAVLAAGRAQGLRHTRQLTLAAAVPPLASFAVSSAMPDSVWGSRHLIVAAVPFMILLAASAAALRPLWIRRSVLALMTAWIAWGAVSVTLRPEPHANLEVMMRQFAARTAGERVVTVYSLDRYLPGWMGYYLEAYRGTSWNLKAITDPRAAAGDHFWLAYNEKFWHDRRTPQQILRERGYETGQGIWAADELNRFILVPVRRRN
ncbi:MAG TPA: glycosyltransferase family 39 protein [Bryobacteraceae bacterium]|nr:glycosyltransferase family 39 protein [Bryobacteraceae bacterium]